MRPIHQVKNSFERRRIRTGKIASGLQTFYVSNDHYSLAQMLQDRPDQKTDVNEVSILVGESDLFSVIEKLPGDIIVCDIDRRLLAFMEAQYLFFRSCYIGYQTNHLGFPQIRYRYSQFLYQYPHKKIGQKGKNYLRNKVNSRRERLGELHFLYNEYNFIRAMEAVKNKEMVVLDINLFDRAEQDCLAFALRRKSVAVGLFQATNVADYDPDDCLVDLFEKLPWTEYPLLLWSIHNRGPYKSLRCHEEYFFCDRPQYYRVHADNRPYFFADLDRLTLGRSLNRQHLDRLRRYIPDPDRSFLQKDQRLDKREQYLARITCNHWVTVKKFCEIYGVKWPGMSNLLFLIVLDKTIRAVCAKLEADYPDKSLTSKLVDYLQRQRKHLWHSHAGAANRQVQIKAEIVKGMPTCSHRLFDTRKHPIIKIICNIFMLFPVFGVVKYLITGSYFFYEKTRRERIVLAEIAAMPKIVFQS